MREIEKPEGVYGFIGGHVYFDCKCGSLSCKYKSEGEGGDARVVDAIRNDAESMIANDSTRYKNSEGERMHTFWQGLHSLSVLIGNLDFFRREGQYERGGLTFICEGCNQDFTITPKILEKLTSES